jgi:hypothetical protein
MNIEKRKVLILLSIVAAAAVIGGIILNAYSVANANSNVNDENGWNNFAGLFNGGMMARVQGWSPRGMHGRGCYGFIEVSEEFKENVINIAKKDTDVQNLLNEGYNITGVRPIIKTIVEGDGTVVTKATNAIVILEKDTTGYAIVKVDVANAKVTEIVILTETVIEKP